MTVLLFSEGQTTRLLASVSLGTVGAYSLSTLNFVYRNGQGAYLILLDEDEEVATIFEGCCFQPPPDVPKYCNYMDFTWDRMEVVRGKECWPLDLL